MTDAHENDPGDFDKMFEQRERQDAAATATQEDSKVAVDATMMFEPNEMAKKERDVAFAIALLQTGHMSERQLTGAVKQWTIHGDQQLSDHLVNRKLITAQIREKLIPEANQRLESATARAASRSSGGNSSISNSTLAQLDTNGRVAKLLGLGVVQGRDATDQIRTLRTEYRLLRKLGQGGMGTVWLAHDEKLGRLVAIKEIHNHGSDPESTLYRFRREAQVTGRLEHPSIVPIHEMGECEDTGKTFYVMRFLGKRTLEEEIAEYHERRDAGDVNPMHLHRLLTAFVTVCQAIAYAHSRNVVHRDLKPENIALDDYGQVIVLDWGLAKLTGRGELQEIFGDIQLGELNAANDTSAGQVLGTPMYMAPEQAAGRIDEIEQTTDVYGLGAVLFSILTGYAPHEKSNQTKTSTTNVSELFQTIVSSEAPRARSLNPEVPAELDAVCAKAMANKRYARYATALELADDVQRWMAGEPVSTCTEPLPKRIQRWMGAHRRISQVAVAALITVGVIVVTLGMTSYQNRRAQQQARFEGIKADGRELEVSLQSIAQDIIKDARFMEALPPIQGIVNSRAGIEGDDEQVWRERLETIYQGLLEANPAYLSASYVAAADEVEEIVRVERQSAGSFVRVLPVTRLATLQNTGLIEDALGLEPGEVAIADTTVPHVGDSEEPDDRLILTSGIPVYSNIDGSVFGVVAVETDLEDMLRELLRATVETGEDAYVVDAKGIVILHYSREEDFQQESVGVDVGQLVDGLNNFFSPENLDDHFSDGRETYGVKIHLDPRNTAAMFGVVLTVKH